MNTQHPATLLILEFNNRRVDFMGIDIEILLEGKVNNKWVNLNSWRLSRFSAKRLDFYIDNIYSKRDYKIFETLTNFDAKEYFKVYCRYWHEKYIPENIHILTKKYIKENLESFQQHCFCYFTIKEYFSYIDMLKSKRNIKNYFKTKVFFENLKEFTLILQEQFGRYVYDNENIKDKIKLHGGDFRIFCFFIG